MDAEKNNPAADGADDHEEHQEHHEHREDGEQILPGREVLVDDEPDAGPEGDDRHEDARHARDPGVLGLVHAQDDRGADQKRHRGEQLVADAEERPDRTDVARVDEVAPGAREDDGRDDDARPPFFVGELRPDLAHHFLQEEAAHAGARVNGRQNEDGFKHDGEVVPVGHQVFHEGDLREDVRHADGERHRAARTGHQRFLNLRFEVREFDDLHAELRELVGRRVDREVVGRNEHAGGDQGHHGDEAFHEHGAVTDEEHVAFVADHLRGRARADRRVEARERAAGDRDEDERNHRTAHDRAAALDEFREGGHMEFRHHEGDAERERGDRADLEEGREVVAGKEKEPDGENRGDEAVDRDDEAHRLLVDVKPAEVFGMRRNPGTREDAEEEEHHADHARALHVALAPHLHVETHDHGDRDRAEDRVGRPERIVHGVHDRDRKTREREAENGEHRPGRDEPRRLVDFGRGDVGERAAAVAHRAEEHDHVVHAAREHAADQNPEKSGHVAELCRQHRPEQRARCGDGREMVSEKNVLVRRHVVLTVGVFHGGGLTGFIDVEHLGRDEQTVEAVCDRKDAQGGKDNGQRVDAGSCLHLLFS